MSPTLLLSVFPDERWFISPMSNAGIAYLYLCLCLDFRVLLYDILSTAWLPVTRCEGNIARLPLLSGYGDDETSVFENETTLKIWLPLEMKSKQTTPTGVVMSFEKIPNPALSPRIPNDNVQGEAINSRPLATKKSCGGGKNGKSSFN